MYVCTFLKCIAKHLKDESIELRKRVNTGNLKST